MPQRITPLLPAPTTTAFTFALAFAACALTWPCAAQLSPDDEALNLPRGGGIPLQPYTPNSPPRVAGRLWDLTFARPQGWLVHHDGTSWLLEPSSANPGDLGALLLITATADAPPTLAPLAALPNADASADPDAPFPPEARAAWERLLTDMGARATLTAAQVIPRPTHAKGSPSAVHVALLAGQFDTGAPARWLAMSWQRDGALVIAVAGASDRAFGPFQGLLQDLLLSIELQPR
jgi:hypothetical protein